MAFCLFLLWNHYYYYQNEGASNMNEKVEYLPRQNPIKLKKNMQTDTRKTGNYRIG